jgi:hypothetical protein
VVPSVCVPGNIGNVRSVTHLPTIILRIPFNNRGHPKHGPLQKTRQAVTGLREGQTRRSARRGTALPAVTWRFTRSGWRGEPLSTSKLTGQIQQSRIHKGCTVVDRPHSKRKKSAFCGSGQSYCLSEPARQVLHTTNLGLSRVLFLSRISKAVIEPPTCHALELRFMDRGRLYSFERLQAAEGLILPHDSWKSSPWKGAGSQLAGARHRAAFERRHRDVLRDSLTPSSPVSTNQGDFRLVTHNRTMRLGR